MVRNLPIAFAAAFVRWTANATWTRVSLLSVERSTGSGAQLISWGKLEILIQSRQNETAAARFLRKLVRKQMRTQYVMITGKLGSNGAAEVNGAGHSPGRPFPVNPSWLFPSIDRSGQGDCHEHR
ncbi:MAG: hypothetical protein WAM29_13365 [Methylocella sp.]